MDAWRDTGMRTGMPGPPANSTLSKIWLIGLSTSPTMQCRRRDNNLVNFRIATKSQWLSYRGTLKPILKLSGPLFTPEWRQYQPSWSRLSQGRSTLNTSSTAFRYFSLHLALWTWLHAWWQVSALFNWGKLKPFSGGGWKCAGKSDPPHDIERYQGGYRPHISPSLLRHCQEQVFAWKFLLNQPAGTSVWLFAERPLGEQGGVGGGDGSRRERMRIIRGGGRSRVITYFAVSCLINTKFNKVIKVALWTKREFSSSSSGSRCRPKSGKLLERCWVPSRRRSWPIFPRLEGWRRGRGKKQRRWNI